METTKLNQFLELTKKKVLTEGLQGHILRIVFGNESCDLDTAVCTLAYGFFLEFNMDKNKPNVINLPLMNTFKNDLPLKTEVCYFLEKKNITLSNIVCRDEIDLKKLIPHNKIELILVDHHILNKRDEYLFPFVVQIFDHRPKDEINWKYENRVEFTITKVGSCASLICQEIINCNEKYLHFYKNASELLHGTIVLDTINFSHTAEKTTPLDIKIAEFLENIIGIEDKEIFRTELFNDLHRARVDYSKLSPSQLLQRDLKIMNSVAIPGLPMLARIFLENENSEETLKTFCNEFRTPIVLIMGLEIKNNTIVRDLALYNSNDDYKEYQRIIDEIYTPESNLDLQEEPHEMIGCRYFIQKNVKMCRKQIIPMIKYVTKE